jgi:AcrR family transcriptional regulator
MSESVKSGQPGQAGRGQARTRLARRAVIAAARELFRQRGYAATTIDAVSAGADVPVATVYRLFGSKLGILKALVDTSISGDDDPVAVPDRPEVATAFAETDPARLLGRVAALTTAINQRSNDVYRVLVSAAGSDPAAAGLLASVQDQRDQGQGQIVRALARTGSLRAGLTADTAADVIHALMSPEVYGLLVIDRSWPPARYREWLAATLSEQLT